MFFKVFKCNSHLIKFCLFLIQAIHMLILTLEMDTYCNKKYVLMFLKYFLHFAGSLMFTTEYLLQKFFK